MTHVVDAQGLRAALAAEQPVRLLDVRWRLDQPEGRPAYLAAHLPGAVYVDLERELSRVGHPEDGRFPLPGPDALERAARGWGLNDGDLVVAYDDNDGVAASRAWWSGRGNAASSPRVMRRSAASHGATQSNPATRCAASRARAPTV